jgi:HK97 family phage portal protein
MIVAGALQDVKQPPVPAKLDPVPDPSGSVYAGRVQTKSKQLVSPEMSKAVAVVYRCSNAISDDIAKMSLQQFVHVDDGAKKVQPDAAARNMAYLLEVSPNRYMAPFIMVKTIVTWLQFWGNALIWMPPPPAPRELFILPTNRTWPRLAPNGDLWFEVQFPNGDRRFIPAVEVLHLMINSTNGIWGRSVLEYARDTIGNRLAMSQTQSSLLGNGLTPAAYIQVNATLDKQGREKYREAYSEVIMGAENAGNLAVFDNKVVKFEPILMKMTDAQFLESLEFTDGDIANFFMFPEYKLNMGKQSYESNDQQDEDYLKTTIDPYIVQWEQMARLRWLTEEEQDDNYFRFNRKALLRMNAKMRAEIDEIRIRSGTRMPNEARKDEDENSYPDGNQFWMLSQNLPVGAGGATPPKPAAVPVPAGGE